MSIVELRNGTSLPLSGLSDDGIITRESPDGTHILIGYKKKTNKEKNNIFSLGLLNTKTGVYTVLNRETDERKDDYIYGWADNTAIILRSYDREKKTNYISVYDFEP